MFDAGLILITIGIAVLIVAAILLILGGARGKGKVKGGAVVMIGPVPIIFGTDKQSLKIVLVLAIILMALLIALMILPGLL